MSKLTRDGTAEPVPRDQILSANGDREILINPVQLTTCGIGNLTRLIHTLAICVTIHTYIHSLRIRDRKQETETRELSNRRGKKQTKKTFPIPKSNNLNC